MTTALIPFRILLPKLNSQIENDPRNVSLRCDRATAYLRRGWRGDVSMALSDLSCALSVASDYFRGVFLKAKCYVKLRKYDIY